MIQINEFSIKINIFLFYTILISIMFFLLNKNLKFKNLIKKNLILRKEFESLMDSDKYIDKIMEDYKNEINLDLMIQEAGRVKIKRDKEIDKYFKKMRINFWKQFNLLKPYFIIQIIFLILILTLNFNFIWNYLIFSILILIILYYLLEKIFNLEILRF